MAHDKVVTPDAGVGRRDLHEAVYGTRDLSRMTPATAEEDEAMDNLALGTAEVDHRATRHNDGKPPLSYLMDAPVAMTGFALVMKIGEAKYGRDNWKDGLDPNEIVDSLLRHLQARKNGEALDPESGLDHYHHVLANAVFLAEQEGLAPRLFFNEE